MPSSVIYGMRYDPRNRVLEVVFRGSGEVYRYRGVPREVWRQFVRAPSKGTFLNTVFKEKGYAYERLEGWAPLPQMAASAMVPPAEEGLMGRAPGAEFQDHPDANMWGFYE